MKTSLLSCPSSPFSISLLAAVLSGAGGQALAQGADQSPSQLAERLVSVVSTIGGDGPQWAPDGLRILYPANQGGGMAIWSVTPDGGAPVRVTRDVGPQIPRLSPDGRSVAYLSDKSGSPELWLAAAGGDRETQLTDLGARINAFNWSPDGRQIAFSALLYGQFDVWTVTVPGGEVRRLTTDARFDLYPGWTPDSRRIVFTRADDRWVAHDVMIMDATGENARVVTRDQELFDYGTLGTRSTFGYVQVSPDGGSLLFRSHRSGWLNFWTVPLSGGAPKQLAPEEADQTDARWSPDGKSVAFVSNHNGTRDVRVAAVTGGRPRVVVPVQLGIASSPDWSPDGKRLAYTLATPTRPSELHVVSVDNPAGAKQLTFSKLPVEDDLLVPEKVSYRSDQFTISAYVYKPRTIQPGARLPGILYIHGGPTGQFSDNFALQPQFLARMGYVVLMPNIRGSSGYGKVFEDANNPCWTHCDLRDVVAGAEYLKTLPYVNASKIGITGISYGGIMSMAAVAHAPDVFQASMPQSGYANWISFHEYNAELQHTKLLAYEWGPYPDSAAVYRRNSSIFSASKVKAPVFLVHGVGRETSWRPGVVPIVASKEYALALEKEYKVVLYKTYPNETYYVSGRDNSRQLLLDMLDFFDRYLKDQGARSLTRTSSSR